MPVDREAWARQLHLSTFVNTYYQYQDLMKLPGVKKLLVVGSGHGLDVLVFKWRGFQVETLDIDPVFRPDHVGSLHDLSAFGDEQFDVIVASHVLEHLAVTYLDRCLEEMARVARFALVYLPVAGRHSQIRLNLGIRGIDLSWEFDLFNWFHRPDGVTPRYQGGQHFWELGYSGFREPDLIARFSRYFHVLASYRNPDWIWSHNFRLASKRYHP